MGGRPSKPTNLIIVENKSHRTKSEIEFRKQAEQSLYTGEFFKESAQVKENEIAHKEFLRLKRLYSKIDYIDGLDEQIINRYCLEVDNLYKMQERLNSIEKSLENVEDYTEKIKFFEIIDKALNKINKSKDLLLKYEDRLFLNPTSRIKSIPKTPPEKEKESSIKTFMSKRAIG